MFTREQLANRNGRKKKKQIPRTIVYVNSDSSHHFIYIVLNDHDHRVRGRVTEVTLHRNVTHVRYPFVETGFGAGCIINAVVELYAISERRRPVTPNLLKQAKRKKCEPFSALNLFTRD